MRLPALNGKKKADAHGLRWSNPLQNLYKAFM